MRNDLHTLRRYFVSANLMRRQFYNYVAEHPGVGLDSREFPEYFTYMSRSCSTPWIALDGWRQLRLTDADMTRVLATRRFRLLNDFRNATMHYQRQYITPKHRGFIADPESVPWAHEAHDTLRTAILTAIREHKQDPNSSELRPQIGGARAESPGSGWHG